jgi:uncharacterized protein YkwD
VRAAFPATRFESLSISLSSRRAILRVSLAAISFAVLIAASYQAPAQAGPKAGAPAAPEPLLPQTVGVALENDATITIAFDEPMDPASVEDSLLIVPAQRVDLQWDETRTELTVVPASRWRADERYLVVVDGSAETDGGEAMPASRRFTFTTQSAPEVVEFQVHLAATAKPGEGGADLASARAKVLEADRSAGGADTALSQPIGKGATAEVPDDTATDVSASSSISIGFSHPMNLADVEEHFLISPAVEGALTWSGDSLVFTPSERLAAGMRYTISLIGAHDAEGNLLGDTSSFSFVVQDGAQITKTTPSRNADDAGGDYVQMWFSQPMDVERTNAAFALIDTMTGQPVGGHLVWNEASTQIWFTPDAPLSGGRTFRVVLEKGARDTFGNAVKTDWEFTTGATGVTAGTPSVRSSTSTRSVTVPPAGPATTLAGYALNQVNAARAAYGFAPLVLDPAISAVAASHAYDQASNGYFSHTGRDGSSRQTRLARGGVSFGWSGENQCYHVGMSEAATLDWCHAQFMSEPWPGYWNHIGNILNPQARRLGVGIATVGGRTIITWDFAD